MTTSAQIIAFPNRSTANDPAITAAAHTSTVPPIKANVLTTNSVKIWLLKPLYKTFLYTVFLLLSWISGPVRWICRFIATLSLLALPIVALGLHDDPRKTGMLWGLAAAGFICFSAAWFFGVLLSKLSPEVLAFD